jgi:hypothetical protein
MASQFKFKRPFTPLKQVNIDFTHAVRDRLLQVNSHFRQTVLSEHFRRPSSAPLQAGFSKRRSSIHFYPTDTISPAFALIAAAALTPPATDLLVTPTSATSTLTHSLPSSPTRLRITRSMSKHPAKKLFDGVMKGVKGVGDTIRGVSFTNTDPISQPPAAPHITPLPDSPTSEDLAAGGGAAALPVPHGLPASETPPTPLSWEDDALLSTPPPALQEITPSDQADSSPDMEAAKRADRPPGPLQWEEEKKVMQAQISQLMYQTNIQASFIKDQAEEFNASLLQMDTKLSAALERTVQ